MKKKILVIDDNIELLEEFKDALIDSGYDVSAVSDGMKAVYAARKTRPDLIILDLKMEPRSGFEIASELKQRKDTASIPIIAMSAFYPKEKDDWLKRFCNISIFLKKPFSPSHIITHIEKLTEESNKP